MWVSKQGDAAMHQRRRAMMSPYANESMNLESQTRPVASGMRRKAENGQNGRATHCAAPIK